ncbi:MAG: HD domain-containing protein [Treponema sp.]|jgi:HD-GYP domain-containing protein (c-di-GMP phosphodiesterase class II)|nr:HD domain-containing protein [Treponema sp.]
MKNHNVKDIAVGALFSKPLYIDDQFILLSPEMPFSPVMAQALMEWEFKVAYSDGAPVLPGEQNDREESIFAKVVSEKAVLRRIELFYAVLEKYTETLFAKASAGKQLDYQSLSIQMTEACELIRKNRLALLSFYKKNAVQSGQNNKIYHAIRTLVIAVGIGFFYKLSKNDLAELGSAALLHEIGMVKLPSNTYISKRTLNPGEKNAIHTHPLLGYSLLKALDFPLTVCNGVLQHQERENGSGYPRQIRGDTTCLHAKIIAVACSYAAITEERLQKPAKDVYKGMMEIIHNEGKQYDQTVIRAFLHCICIYPVGSHVLLSNSSKGQVVNFTLEAPQYPCVRLSDIVGPDGKKPVVQTSPMGVHIVRLLSSQEIVVETS